MSLSSSIALEGRGVPKVLVKRPVTASGAFDTAIGLILRFAGVSKRRPWSTAPTPAAAALTAWWFRAVLSQRTGTPGLRSGCCLPWTG